MTYRVHRFGIDKETDTERLEAFLNDLDGEVVAVVPDAKRTSLMQIYGMANRVDALLVIERTG